MNVIDVALLLVAGHAVCDYPLQGDFLALAKNLRAPIAGVPWWIAMAAHSAIHAGCVGLILGSSLYGLMEFCAHFAIDVGKCQGRFGFKTDQALHIATKAVLLAVWFAAGGVA